ncbi:hypothetical protein [Mucilaginibacter defluvii]|uniref:T9SS C-terminal target domain-containing protein n=1 Tax=Mucilaginibacter defluvii TaxID=1196019 RepID=A0ABP9FS80_9SPHI
MVNQIKNAGVAAMVAAALFTTSCKKEKSNDGSGYHNRSKSAGFTNPTQSIPVNADGAIQDNFDGNATDNVINLTNSTVWLIDGISYVPSGKTLKIPAGTILSSGAFKTYAATEEGVSIIKDIRGVLLVVKGAKLDAQGTEALPIVFTSPNAPGSRAAGDFGGIILLGDAPTNQPDYTEIEGLPYIPGTNTTYGGTDVTDNSGIMQYVRIEYAGYLLIADQGVNGLTCGGVGSGTTLDHIQVTYAGDDSFEFFGGTVNASYLIAAGGFDDDFDFTYGYTGTIQYAVVLKALNSTHSTIGTPTISDANGIESDNDRQGSSLTPKTRPVLKNFTVLGTSTDNPVLRLGARFRRNTNFDLQNSVIGGFPAGVTVENGSSGIFGTNIVHAFSATGAYTPASTATPANNYLLLGAVGTNPFYTDHTTAYNINALIPRSTSPIAATQGAVSKGTAAGATWLKNWTLFTAQNKVY